VGKGTGDGGGLRETTCLWMQKLERAPKGCRKKYLNLKSDSRTLSSSPLADIRSRVPDTSTPTLSSSPLADILSPLLRPATARPVWSKETFVCGEEGDSATQFSRHAGHNSGSGERHELEPKRRRHSSQAEPSSNAGEIVEPAARRDDAPTRMLGAAQLRKEEPRGPPQQGFRRAPKGGLQYVRDLPNKETDNCPMECPMGGHRSPADRLKHVTVRLKPLLAGAGTTQYSAQQFSVFGHHAMVAWTAVQLCELLSGTNIPTPRAAAMWGLGSLVCEVVELQNFIAGGAIIISQIFSDACRPPAEADKADEALQSCAVYAIACLTRFNTRLQDRAIADRNLVQNFTAVLLGSTKVFFCSRTSNGFVPKLPRATPAAFFFCSWKN